MLYYQFWTNDKEQRIQFQITTNIHKEENYSRREMEGFALIC